MESAVLGTPVPCGWQLGPSDWCMAHAFGPPEHPRCPDHGGPEVQVCESCDGAITDDAEAFDCPRYSGPVHVGCHPADCRSVECREALSDPTQYADERG